MSLFNRGKDVRSTGCAVSVVAQDKADVRMEDLLNIYGVSNDHHRAAIKQIAISTLKHKADWSDVACAFHNKGLKLTQANANLMSQLYQALTQYQSDHEQHGIR